MLSECTRALSNAGNTSWLYYVDGGSSVAEDTHVLTTVALAVVVIVGLL